MRPLLRMYGPLLAVLVALYLAYRYLLALALPFAISAGIAILVDPAVTALERRLRLPRSLAVGVTLAGLFAAVLLFLLVGIASIASEVRLLIDDVGPAYERVEANVRELAARAGRWWGGLPPAVQRLLEQQQAGVVYALQVWLNRAAAVLQGWLAKLPDLVAQVLIVAIATFLLSRDKEAVQASLIRLVPEPWREQVDRMARRLAQSLVGFVVAMTVLIVLTATATALGLAALGSRYALLLGVLAGVLDVLPVLGPALLFVPWAAYHLVFGDFVFGVGLLVLWGLITGVRILLQAQVIGERIGLHPLTTLLALYAGAKLLGPAGLVLGPLTAVLLKAMVDVGLLRFGSGQP